MSILDKRFKRKDQEETLEAITRALYPDLLP
jgi:hypothetical protein